MADALSPPDDDKVLRAALGLSGPRALVLSDQRFPAAEAAVVSLLSRRERVTRSMVMIATADPVGEDERDAKLADVLICKVRPKLEALGVPVHTEWGECWTVPGAERKRLKAMVAAAWADEPSEAA